MPSAWLHLPNEGLQNTQRSANAELYTLTCLTHDTGTDLSQALSNEANVGNADDPKSHADEQNNNANSQPRAAYANQWAQTP